jgi:hypothetical protein
MTSITILAGEVMDNSLISSILFIIYTQLYCHSSPVSEYGVNSSWNPEEGKRGSGFWPSPE